MCGLNGIFAYHPSASSPREQELFATREHMRARGPDGAGIWWSPERRCGLAHRRLAILDLSDRAAQPMASTDGSLAVVFNGEIYNYPELKAELERDGAAFRSTSDTEVLIHLYQRFGAKMVAKLRGMFAFAIWDQKKRGIFLARDPYGIKPLYISNDGWTFRFASQVKALLAGGAVSRDPEPAGIVGFHLFGSVPEPFTLYRDISSLPAGHTLWVDRMGMREPQRYHSIATTLAKGAREKVESATIDARVRAAALDSVRAHMLADVEVGLFLSAGVDSGALLGLIHDATGANVRAITLAFSTFAGTQEDEAPLAAKIAERYGAQHIVRHVNEAEFRHDLPNFLATMDQPTIDGVNTWFACKAAAEAGLKVALSGLGGDEILAGYPSFVDIPRWVGVFAGVRMIPGLGPGLRLLGSAIGLSKNTPKIVGMPEYGGTYPGAYLLRRGLLLPFELQTVLAPDVIRNGLFRLNLFANLSASLMPDPGSALGRVAALESCHYMRNQLLRDSDWTSMAHSVELRTPLVDSKFLSDVAPLLPHLGRNRGKYALANAPSNPLPDEVAHRAKTGFVVPMQSWTHAALFQPALPVGAKGLVSRNWAKHIFRTYQPAA
ncbi:asparagine synthase (glutamine-hydrolyzing) [Rhodoblastus acidophilus]|uniref:asparagine synthase (glutamine-hydrolyzing) n=1 Tax=Rhodoblastus acidophilus TaxID=1074 RepID=UPI0022252BCF|nr:asparagine synthase (glutamine-hydrolyzing) [Rhodoblastus acidophilus]MCW2284303.1 asparagine synthase (glutamine-hydrolyzing) [Rhodoblastus acidophilus]MCW2333219.1 asparagine synthase (glutamine-hydrolyzing) [Rhodoblastus acidophilus]